MADEKIQMRSYLIDKALADELDRRVEALCLPNRTAAVRMAIRMFCRIPLVTLKPQAEQLAVGFEQNDTPV